VSDIFSFITKDEISGLREIRPFRLIVGGVCTWAIILGSMVVGAKMSGWGVYLASFFLIATRQHALNQYVHEASHFNLSRNKVWNDWISDIFFAAPHFVNTQGYRDKHLLHHGHLGQVDYDSEFNNRHLIRG
jgi:fatty acid desaturase